MSRWYGFRGHWLGVGLPTYISIDRKLEIGCEIQFFCCGNSGILMKLLIFKSADEDDCNTTEDIPRGTKEPVELFCPWLGTWRLTCGDSHFASVRTAAQLYQNVINFERCIKNGAKKYSMKPLGQTALEEDGESLCMTLFLS